MAITGHLHKIVFGGTVGTTETWSCSLHFISPDAGVILPAVFESAIVQWFTRPDTKSNGTAVLEYIKCNEIVPTTGKYLDEAAANTLFLDPVVPGASGGGAPHLTAAVSTWTAAARGLGSKGRFFPPTGGVEGHVGADGRLGTVIAQLMAASASQLITDINGDAIGECYVFSRQGQVALEISGTRVGRVLDTQQRRRKNLVEDHQSVPVS